MNSLTTFNAEGLTHVGQVRSTNQDSLLMNQAAGLFIVADGMGGHAGGEIASKLCVDEVDSFLSAARNDLTPAPDTAHPSLAISNILAQAINHASTKIYEKSLENPSLRGMGTTATICKIIDSYAYIAHVGDSRCYLLRGGFIYQLTNDHSLVGEQLRAGLITKEEAESHHLRNVITRSVGYQEEEDVDTTSICLETNDFLLLCSDGLHGKVSDKELSQILGQNGILATQKLIDLANERGGDDNINVIIIHIPISSPSNS